MIRRSSIPDRENIKGKAFEKENLESLWNRKKHSGWNIVSKEEISWKDK